MGLWIDVGSRYETANNNGVAHFLEHMFFKVITSPLKGIIKVLKVQTGAEQFLEEKNHKDNLKHFITNSNLLS